MIRLTVLALLTGLLAACNTGDSFLEWDAETQAMLDAQEAQAEAARNQGTLTDEEILAQANGESGAAAQSTAAPAAVAGPQIPLVLLDAQGGTQRGMLVHGSEASSQIEVLWEDGSHCSGGLVGDAGNADTATGTGTLALNCSNGTIWLGKYASAAMGQGAWSLRSASGMQARAVFGADVPAGPVDAGAFDGLWASRAPTPPPA